MGLRWGQARGRIQGGRAMCDDGRVRMCYVTGEPDTYFSRPARAKVYDPARKGMATVTGSLYFGGELEEPRISFGADRWRKNAGLLAGGRE